MGPLADAFMEMYPDVQINITGSGSGTGISDTAGGLNDFACPRVRSRTPR